MYSFSNNNHKIVPVLGFPKCGLPFCPDITGDKRDFNLLNKIKIVEIRAVSVPIFSLYKKKNKKKFADLIIFFCVLKFYKN